MKFKLRNIFAINTIIHINVFRVATGQAKSVFLEKSEKSQAKSGFLWSKWPKVSFLGRNNKMSDFVSSNLQNSLISKVFKW